MFSKITQLRKDLDKLDQNIKKAEKVIDCTNDIKDNIKHVNELKEEFKNMEPGPVLEGEIVNKVMTNEYIDKFSEYKIPINVNLFIVQSDNINAYASLAGNIIVIYTGLINILTFEELLFS